MAPCPSSVTAIATIVLAGATLLLAAFTAWMAWGTKQVVEQNKTLMKAEDRHHMENLRPCCILEIVDPQKRNWGSALFAAEYVGSIENREQYVMLNCRVVNKGLGPAFGIDIGITTSDERQHVGFTLPVLAAGESFSIKQKGYQVPEMIPFFAESLPPLAHNLLPGVHMYLEYKDMFHNAWRSSHLEKVPGVLLIDFQLIEDNGATTRHR